VEELLVERGVEVDHVTVYRWVQRFTPRYSVRPPVGRPIGHANGKPQLNPRSPDAVDSPEYGGPATAVGVTDATHRQSTG
jgi:hypothetical protein